MIIWYDTIWYIVTFGVFQPFEYCGMASSDVLIRCFVCSLRLFIFKYQPPSVFTWAVASNWPKRIQKTELVAVSAVPSAPTWLGITDSKIRFFRILAKLKIESWITFVIENCCDLAKFSSVPKLDEGLGRTSKNLDFEGLNFLGIEFLGWGWSVFDPWAF